MGALLGSTTCVGRAPEEEEVILGRRFLGIRVAPDNAVLEVDLNQVGTLNLRVEGRYADGTTENITHLAALTLDNPRLGKLSGGVFRSAAQGANGVGYARLKARYSNPVQTGGVEMSSEANLTVVWLRRSGNATDFLFKLPYRGPVQKQPLRFNPLVQLIDAYFAVDTTGSMGPSINQLRDSLRNRIIPAVKMAAVREAWFGVGAVEDFQVNPYGRPSVRGTIDDQPLVPLLAMTPDLNKAQAAVDALLDGGMPRGQGGDGPEGQLEALYQIATGAGNEVPGLVSIPRYSGAGLGGAGFREGALPIITVISDAPFHTKAEGRTCGGGTRTDYEGPVEAVAHTRAETVAALNKRCAKVVGISAVRSAGPEPTDACSATADLVRFANDTSTLVPPEAWDVPRRPAACAAGQCCTGADGSGVAPDGSGLCPLVFKTAANGAGVGEQVVSAISQLARFATFDVVASAVGGGAGEMGAQLPAGRTSAEFIKHIWPLDAIGPPPPPALPVPVVTGSGFAKVTPGSVVRFLVDAQNDFQPETSRPQLFHATIKIKAGGCADLDERDVIILIPPSAPQVG